MIKTFTNNLITILDTIILYGGKPIVVGGSVRDYFFNKSCSDYDIEVYNITTIDKLENILIKIGKVNRVGKSFGILKLEFNDNVYDISFPRIENKIGFGHIGFEVTVNPHLSFKEASRRRDFTINSIGYDYSKKQFLDPFNGIMDIRKRVLKHIEKKSFCEDPLRVYRAGQLCARFELLLDNTTKELCIDIVKKDEFKMLSNQRVYSEFKKLLLQAQKPSIGLKIFNELDIIDFTSDLFEKVDKMISYKRYSEKDNLVLMFYFLYKKLFFLVEYKSIIKIIEKLEKFNVPKIYEEIVKNIDDEVELISKKYQIMTNMPKPFLMGKDLINLGYEPNENFGIVLKIIYEKQLEGNICSKKEAEKLLSTLL